MAGRSIALWAADLGVGAARLSELEATLDHSERERAAAIPDPGERRRFVADHGFRRIVLGAATGAEPTAIAYVIDEHRRPSLADPDGPLFSASRSGDLALLAVIDGGHEAPIGVDVEGVPGAGGLPPRSEREFVRLAERIMSTRERAAWVALEPDAREGALTACWTAKEAYGKAAGTGLVFPLSARQVWSGDGRPVRHSGIEVCPIDLAGAVERPHRFRAAVAVRVGDGAPVVLGGVRRVT